MRKEFCDWLRTEINKSGKTQKEFAEIIGIEQPQLSNILLGRRNTSDEVLNKISISLGIPADQVFRLAGKLPPAPVHNQKIDKDVHLLNLSEPDDLEEIIQITRLKLGKNKTTTSNKKNHKNLARTV